MAVISDCLLIDASCALAGYVTDVRGDLTEDSRRIAALCHRFGVGALRDTGSGLAARSRFCSVNNGVEVIGGAIAITDSVPLARNEIVISTVSQISEIITLCAAVKERWLCVRSSNPDFFHSVKENTLLHGISICGRGSGVVQALQVGDIDIVDGVATLLPKKTTSIDALASAAVVSDDEWSMLAEICVKKEVSVCTGLVALRRSVFLKEAIQAPYLEELAPIVPHSQYLQRMRNGAGYLAGRRALEMHSGMREPTSGERQVLDEGWESLTRWIAQAHNGGVTFLPASKAPQLAVLPGYGLLEELTLLTHMGIPPESAVKRATETTANAFGINPIPGQLVVRNYGEKTKDEFYGGNTSSILTKDSLLSLRRGDS